MAEARASCEGRHPRPRRHGRRPGAGHGRPADRGVATAAPESAAPRRVLFVFLDGVGIGPDDPDVNPFLRAELPVIAELCGGTVPTLGAVGRALALDATLGVPGTPQSGTGQAALLTGESTAELYGRHFGPWTPVRLRPLVEERSVLRRAVDAGRTVAFANAYPKGWPGPRGGRRIAGPPLAARGAGALVRHEEALHAGDAVSSEIVNDGWRRHLGFDHLPDLSPGEAGGNLARIAAGHDLTLYAHYTTDTVGHRGSLDEAVEALERVDRFLGGVLHGLDDPEAGTLLVVASDHGNIEDVRGGHTLNPALGIVASARGSTGVGTAPDAPGALPADLRDVTAFVLAALGAAERSG